MDEFLIKLRILLKAEMMLLRLHIRRSVKQTAFYIVAALLAVLSAAMLNVALYFSMVPRLEGTGAALVVALVDLVLAIAVIAYAGRMDLGPEEASAKALAELSMTELASDVERATRHVRDLEDDVRQVRSALTNLLTLGNLNLSSVFQWLMMLINLFRPRRDP
jgi:hypothetical protein